MRTGYVITAMVALSGAVVFLTQAAMDIDGSGVVDVLFALVMLYAAAWFWNRRFDNDF